MPCQFHRWCWWGLITVLLLPAGILQAQSLSPEEDKMVARINELLRERWQQAGIEPVTTSDDSEFLRRVYLDLTGIIPSVSETRAFLADANPNKRQLLIERLLTSPSHATHLAATWRRIL